MRGLARGIDAECIIERRIEARDVKIEGRLINVKRCGVWWVV
jgi:hypothetical protein